MGIPWRVAFALQSCGNADTRSMRTIERVRDAILDEYDGQTPPYRVLRCLSVCMASTRKKGNSWWLRSDVVWRKLNPMPESVTDRPTRSHEFVFLLTKSARYFWDADAVRTPSLDANGS